MLKVAGEQLKSNLTRSGKNLSFETDLLYIDVVNGRIGVKTQTPDVQLDVQGTIKSQELRLTDIADSKKWSILPDINGNLVLSYNSTHIFTLNELSTILDKDNKSIVRMDTLTDLDTSQSTTQADLILKSDGDGTYSFVSIDSLISEDTEFSVLTAGDIQLGITIPNQIDTTGGDLVLDSATNKVIVRGEFAATEKVLLTGETTILDLIASNDVQLNDIKIEDNTITSTAGDLELNSNSGQVNILSDVNIQGELLIDGVKPAEPIIFSETQPSPVNHGNLWVVPSTETLHVYKDTEWLQLTQKPITAFDSLDIGDIKLAHNVAENLITTGGSDLIVSAAVGKKVIVQNEIALTKNVLATGETTILDLIASNDVQLNDIKIEDNTITSTAGDLVLTSNNGVVSVDGELLVNGMKIAQPVIFSDTIPIDANHGNLWMDTINGTMYVRYNDAWIQPSYTPLMPDNAPDIGGGRTIVSETKPTFNIEVGDTWFDLVSGRFYVYAAHNSWIQPGYPLLQGTSPYVAASFISETPPTDSVDGNLWLDSTTGQFYIKAQDTWIQPVTGAAATAQKSTAYTQPTDPGDESVDGDIWFDTLNREIFVRYNRTWLAPAVKGGYESEIRTNELFLSNEWSLRITNNELHFVYQNVPVFEIAPDGLLKVTNDIIADGDVQ